MAFMTLHYFSNTLNKMTEVNIIVPERREADGTVAYDQLHAQPLKTVWLLHGLSGDATDWYRMTGLERYATATGYAVVMPIAVFTITWPTANATGTLSRQNYPSAYAPYFH